MGPGGLRQLLTPNDRGSINCSLASAGAAIRRVRCAPCGLRPRIPNARWSYGEHLGNEAGRVAPRLGGVR